MKLWGYGFGEIPNGHNEIEDARSSNVTTGSRTGRNRFDVTDKLIININRLSVVLARFREIFLVSILRIDSRDANNQKEEEKATEFNPRALSELAFSGEY